MMEFCALNCNREIPISNPHPERPQDYVWNSTVRTVRNERTNLLEIAAKPWLTLGIMLLVSNDANGQAVLKPKALCEGEDGGV